MQHMQNTIRHISVILLVLSLSASPSWADPSDPLAMPTDPQAVKHLENGDTHFRLREFDKAIEEYRAGAKIEATPRFLYNIAQCARQMKDYENAIWYFTQWIKTAKPPAEMRAPIEDIIQKMRDEMEQAATTKPPTDPASAGASPTAGLPPRDQPSMFTARRKIALGVAGGALLALGTGIVLGAQASSLEDDAYAVCPRSPCDDPDAANELADRAERRATFANISFGVATAAAATAVILWFTGAPERPSSHAAVSPVLGPTYVGVEAAMGF